MRQSTRISEAEISPKFPTSLTSHVSLACSVKGWDFLISWTQRNRVLLWEICEKICRRTNRFMNFFANNSI